MTTESVFSAVDAYGAAALNARDPTVLAGRYAAQAVAERRIVPDLIAKLNLSPEDRLLEIGCGPGNLIIPLSFIVREAVGIDHPNVLARLSARFRDERLKLIPGSFPGVAIAGGFNVVIAYSVLHCAPELKAAHTLLDAAMDHLMTGGRLLIGDIPNSDRKSRFLASEAGREFERNWIALRSEFPPSQDAQAVDALLRQSAMIGSFTDDEIAGLASRARARGFEATVLDQNPSLPFGHSREDLLITRP